MKNQVGNISFAQYAVIILFITDAIAEFEKSLITPNSRFDMLAEPSWR